MSIKDNFRIKYGLTNNPTDTQLDSWEKLFDELVRRGYDRESAGREAARQTFADYNRMVYASEADTIEALLAAARNRGKSNR